MKSVTEKVLGSTFAKATADKKELVFGTGGNELSFTLPPHLLSLLLPTFVGDRAKHLLQLGGWSYPAAFFSIQKPGSRCFGRQQ